MTEVPEEFRREYPLIAQAELRPQIHCDTTSTSTTHQAYWYQRVASDEGGRDAAVRDQLTTGEFLARRRVRRYLKGDLR
jgi:hypothetical protein